MRIGTSIFFLALGAILAFAFDENQVGPLNVDMVGWILMGVGLIGLIWSLLASNRGRVSETRTVADPHTGETITRSESHDGL